MQVWRGGGQTNSGTVTRTVDNGGTKDDKGETLDVAKGLLGLELVASKTGPGFKLGGLLGGFLFGWLQSSKNGKGKKLIRDHKPKRKKGVKQIKTNLGRGLVDLSSGDLNEATSLEADGTLGDLDGEAEDLLVVDLSSFLFVAQRVVVKGRSCVRKEDKGFFVFEGKKGNEMQRKR